MEFLEQIQLLGKVALGAFLAGAVGMEREWQRKPAGLRTHMIVGGGSAMLVVLSEVVVEQFSATKPDLVLSDPIRVIQAIIVGLGFMGAGTILKVPSTEKIKYLTTAASFLISASIGIGVAVELYYFSGGSALLIILINHYGNFIKRLLDYKDHKKK